MSNCSHLSTTATKVISLAYPARDNVDTARFLHAIKERYTPREMFIGATREALRKGNLDGWSPDQLADKVFDNYLWTHFACKLYTTYAPMKALAFAYRNIPIDRLASVVSQSQSAILSAFHFVGYPLIAMGLALRFPGLLISKARKDFMDRGKADVGSRVVYLSNRSAGVAMTRALRRGNPVWIMIDVLLPGSSFIEHPFLGSEMKAANGVDGICRVSQSSCIPIFWSNCDEGFDLHVDDPLHYRQGDPVEERLIDLQSRFISSNPDAWLEWYSLADDSGNLRQTLKSVNEKLWAEIGNAMEGGG